MKAKKILKRILAAVITLILVIAVAVCAFIALYKPSVSFDAASLTGSATSRASGFLYGIAQDGVPSYNMTESIGLSSVSTKTALGLQHPIGDADNVAAQALASGRCDYIVVYLQDMYSTWYYEEENISRLREQGEYDWREYIETSFFPLVEKTVNKIKASDYHDNIVYCLYNEPDNGVWFGEFSSEGRRNFYEAWKLTYDYVKSLDPAAVIGGPGYYEYDADKLGGFLEYTSQNACNPDVIIYHELNYRSVYDWQYNAAELRETEAQYGVSDDTPIIVTEYGMMEDNGNPNTMLKYISQIEYSKVYAQQAYWLFANNLCSTAADYNTPNSAWWVYRWYSQLQGQTMQCEISDILHSDMGKAIAHMRAPRYRQFMGLGVLSDDKSEIELLVSGADYDGVVNVESLNETALAGGEVYVEITAVTYQGIAGRVYAPETVKAYKTQCGDTLSIDMDFMNDDTAYRITVRAAQDGDEEYENDNLYTRYEFEDGTLLGSAYTYDSAYASTGSQEGLVGGMENAGDGVELTVDIPESGEYELKLIYGKGNDGPADENGKQNPDDRVSAVVDFSVDGEVSQITLENTVRSEITNTYTCVFELEAGEHTVRLANNSGTYVLDSLLVRKNAQQGVTVLSDKTKTAQKSTVFLAVSPADGFYSLKTAENAALDIDGAPASSDENGSACVYLRRGLNYITVNEEHAQLAFDGGVQSAAQSITLAPSAAALGGTARLEANDAAGVDYIDGISSESGSAEYVFDAPYSGVYKMTVSYSANREQGVHAYNVDLVEDYITLSVNGSETQVYCRNTCSWDNFTTVTVNIELSQGGNTIALFNDGSNKFNNTESFAPHISDITVNSAQG